MRPRRRNPDNDVWDGNRALIAVVVIVGAIVMLILLLAARG